MKFEEKEEVDLWDLPETKAYIKIKNSFRIYFFNYIYAITRRVRKLVNFLNISLETYYGYKNGKYFIPLHIIKNMLTICPENKRNEFISQIKANIEELRMGRRGKSIKNPKLPIKFTDFPGYLSRIAGHIVGDGGIRNQNSDFTVYYTNKCKVLVNKVKEDILKVFGNIDVYEFHNPEDNTYNIRFPSIIGLILTKFFGFQVGELKHIPRIILKSDRKSKAQFLKALFDDEGDMNVLGHKVRFVMANKETTEATKIMLLEFDIRAGKIQKSKTHENRRIQYRFVISSRHDLELFDKTINFDHPEKKEKLKSSLQSYKQYQYKKGEIKNLIIETLNEFGSMNAKELAKKLNRSSEGRFRKQLQKLEKDGLIISNRGKWNLKIYRI